MPVTWNQVAPPKTASQSSSSGSSDGDRRALAVVGHQRWSLGRAGLEEVDAQAPGSPDDRAHVDIEATELRERRIPERAGWQRRHEARGVPELGQRDRDVGLAPAERGFEERGLEEPLAPGRLQPQHELAERDDERRAARRLRHGSRSADRRRRPASIRPLSLPRQRPLRPRPRRSPLPLERAR